MIYLTVSRKLLSHTQGFSTNLLWAPTNIVLFASLRTVKSLSGRKVPPLADIESPAFPVWDFWGNIVISGSDSFWERHHGFSVECCLSCQDGYSRKQVLPQSLWNRLGLPALYHPHGPLYIKQSLAETQVHREQCVEKVKVGYFLTKSRISEMVRNQQGSGWRHRTTSSHSLFPQPLQNPFLVL